jgi:GNAT superfamily N-acetyltransferase
MGRLDTFLGIPGRLRIGSWRGDDDVALVRTVPGTSPTTDELLRILDTATERGHRIALTPALGVTERQVFLANGFVERERLHLLRYDLHGADPMHRSWPTGFAHRRARPADLTEVLALDALAFDGFWRFDRAALLDARAATPRSRYRVAIDATDRIVGYHITGASGGFGFLQRLAVHPDLAGRGIGTALIDDALHWCRRRHCDAVLVNTQESNDRAFALYQRLGFVPEPDGLAVLMRRLDEVRA